MLTEQITCPCCGYKTFDEEMIKNVRQPNKDDQKVENWKPLE